MIPFHFYFSMLPYKLLTSSSFCNQKALSLFGENLCFGRNLVVGYLCYLMLINMTLLESECVKKIFNVDGMGQIRWCLLPPLHQVLEMGETTSHCFDFILVLWICTWLLILHLLQILWHFKKHKRDITHLC